MLQMSFRNAEINVSHLKFIPFGIGVQPGKAVALLNTSLNRGGKLCLPQSN
jgi:hypothetical protein